MIYLKNMGLCHVKISLQVYGDSEDPDQPAHLCSLIGVFALLTESLDSLQLTLVILTSLISNNRLSRSENLVPVLTWKSNNK